MCCRSKHSNQLLIDIFYERNKQGTIIKKIVVRPALGGLPWEAILGLSLKSDPEVEVAVGRMSVEQKHCSCSSTPVKV